MYCYKKQKPALGFCFFIRRLLFYYFDFVLHLELVDIEKVALLAWPKRTKNPKRKKCCSQGKRPHPHFSPLLARLPFLMVFLSFLIFPQMKNRSCHLLPGLILFRKIGFKKALRTVYCLRPT